jgi:hypothetical protein
VLSVTNRSVLLSVIMPNVIMLSVEAPKIIMEVLGSKEIETVAVADLFKTTVLHYFLKIFIQEHPSLL